MVEFSETLGTLEDRGELVAPILPGASWVALRGNFTSNELRAIAKEIDDRFAEAMRNGD